jgi:hypothetical protein
MMSASVKSESTFPCTSRLIALRCRRLKAQKAPASLGPGSRTIADMSVGGVDLILDIDLKLREQPSVAGEVLVLRPAPIGH